MARIIETLLAIKLNKPIELPEWPAQKFTLRKISGFERQAIAQAREEDKTKAHIHMVAVGVSLMLGDADGERVFKDDEVELVKKLPAALQEQIFFEGTEYNMLRTKDADTAKKN